MVSTVLTATREQTLRYRWRATGLDRELGGRGVAPDSLDVLDLGLQDGANHAALLALTARGVSADAARRVLDGFDEELALVWSLRGAPHFSRRDDLPDVQRAVSPWSDADAAKRAVNAGRTLSDACLGALEGLAVLADAMRRAVGRRTMTKGELSAALTPTLDAPYLVDCRPCQATHPHEQLFRLAALHAGLELEPGTNLPSLRRVPGWPRRVPGPATDPGAAPERLQPIRAYLHLLGPATPADLAAFLETTVGEVKAHWPEDAVEVERAGTRAWMLPADLDALKAASERPAAPRLRLLGGFDLLLAAKDRALLVEKARHREVWPTLGRPGVVVLDGEPIGTWRPTSKGRKLTLRADSWGSFSASQRSALEEDAERIASARDQSLDAVVFSG